jgi:hypothetical protein
MSTPRIPDDVRLDLQEMNLTLWACMHPITFDYEWTGNGPKRGRADRSIVNVQLAGPGMDIGPWGTGKTVREAVAAALRHPLLHGRQGGLTGAMATLEEECRLLKDAIWPLRVGDIDDDIPF